MRLNKGRLTAVLFTTVMLLGAASCKKKVPAPPPPPPPRAEPAPAPTPAPKPQAPRIANFTAEPSAIQRGQSSTLSWSVANATTITINQGIGNVQANGTRSVNPGNTTTYTLTASGPGGEDSRTVTVSVTNPPAPPPPPPTARISGADMLSREAQDAYFDYDKSDIRDDARRALTADADLLKRIFASDATFTVVLQGNADERGSAEYNLGLGDRRAISAKDFLVQLGVPADKLKTISYGKERPVCTNATEDCYQRNRHVHLAPGQ